MEMHVWVEEWIDRMMRVGEGIIEKIAPMVLVDESLRGCYFLLDDKSSDMEGDVEIIDVCYLPVRKVSVKARISGDVERQYREAVILPHVYWVVLWDLFIALYCV